MAGKRIEYYQVKFFNDSVKDEHVQLIGYDKNKKVFFAIRFYDDDYSIDEVVSFINEKPIVNLKISDYPRFIDLFRNERPLFFEYIIDSNVHYKIYTMWEKVGDIDGL